MNKRSILFTSSLICLGISILAIPQCMQKDNSLYGWFSGLFWAEHKYDFRGLEEKKNVFPMVVIGSGPAGLTAGLYGARAKKKTLIIEGTKPGGLLTETSYVENWPGFKAILGKDLMTGIREQVERLGASFTDDSVEKVDFSKWPFTITTDDGKVIYALTVIIATGASPSPLNIPGEKEFFGRGVTTCAICDAPFYNGKEVVVIGGGDSAVAEAIQLAAYAKKITILVRKDKMRAAAASQDLLTGYKHISVMYNVEPKEIVGDKDHVTGIKLFNTQTQETIQMPIDGVFLAVGHKPNTKLFKGQVELDKGGYVVLKNHTAATSVPGVFAAGDVEDHRYRQAIVSAGHGSCAALDADAFLNEIGFTGDIAARLQENQVVAAHVLPSMVKHVNSLVELEQEIANTQKPVFVDFYADYCPSCMQMLPHFNAVAQQFKDYALFISVDIAALPDIATKFHVTKIPALLIFKDGTLAARYSNAMSKKELCELAAEYVGHTECEK